MLSIQSSTILFAPLQLVLLPLVSYSPLLIFTSGPAGTLRLWERLPSLRMLKFKLHRFDKGPRRLVLVVCMFPHLEELALIDSRVILPLEWEIRPRYCDSVLRAWDARAARHPRPLVRLPQQQLQTRDLGPHRHPSIVSMGAGHRDTQPDAPSLHYRAARINTNGSFLSPDV